MQEVRKMFLEINMLNQMKQIFIITALLLSLAACTRTSPEPAFVATPAITISAMSHDTLTEFVDQLVLNIEYQDGDGDLGNADADVNSIFVKDSRLSVADEYYLAPLAPEGSNISIQGTLSLKLSTTFILGNSNQETLDYTIYMVDRAGNQSNVIQTSQLLVVRE